MEIDRLEIYNKLTTINPFFRRLNKFVADKAVETHRDVHLVQVKGGMFIEVNEITSGGGFGEIDEKINNLKVFFTDFKSNIDPDYHVEKFKESKMIDSDFIVDDSGMDDVSIYGGNGTSPLYEFLR